ncbi:hypothetical protein [Epinotia aporema granulovirus]|uniref:Uncharacterized protein n=1 Tax=Epinotia aporema granulovirus TaxID=166056 RepID=K4EQU0_9BBAC|nr:hypothetical protein [Epinotia aporema granulovirus]AER41521.1 hypothetical protein [Epinotia aporema granulovirus]
MDYNYAPDGAHRHHELEKVQKEILQQHNHLQTQLNKLKDDMKYACSRNGLCGVDYDTAGVYKIKKQPSKHYRF